MHELSLMGDILTIVERDSASKGIRQVSKVDLLVGPLSNAMPDALQMAFMMFKAQKTTILNDDAVLGIEWETALARCVLCGLEYTPEQAIALCPACKFPSGELLAGDAFRVISYEGS